MKRRKKQVIETDPDVTQVIELVDEDIKVIINNNYEIINIFHMSKVEKSIKY